MSEWEEKIEKMAEHTVNQNVTHIAGVPTWTIVLIRRLFEMKGTDNLRDIWPNLELYIHGGVSFRPYREQFHQLIRGEGMHYMETYNASEGFFAFQDRADADDMLLMPDYGIYYEFIPAEEFEQEDPQTVGWQDVEAGKKLCSGHFNQLRFMAIQTGRYRSFHHALPAPHPDIRTSQTFHQCLWRRGHS